MRWKFFTLQLPKNVDFCTNDIYNIGIKVTRRYYDMVNFKLNDIVYSARELEKHAKLISDSEREMLITIGVEQRLSLESNVILNWELVEDYLEGIYILKFQFRRITEADNITDDFLYYQVKKDANEVPILIRTSK